MISTLQYQTLQLAIKHGGSFISTLAAAGLKADPLNRNRLFEAFPELEASYGPASAFWASHVAMEHQRREVTCG